MALIRASLVSLPPAKKISLVEFISLTSCHRSTLDNQDTTLLRFMTNLSFFPLSTLMLCGIRDTALVINPEDGSVLKRILGVGSQIRLALTYYVQENPNEIPQALTISTEYLQELKSIFVLLVLAF